jgi:hypothetical protein
VEVWDLGDYLERCCEEVEMLCCEEGCCEEGLWGEFQGAVVYLNVLALEM